MEKIKESFLDLMKHKGAFAYAIIRASLAFLFFLGIVLLLAVDSNIISGHVSIAQLPIGGILILISLIILFGQFYTIVVKDAKLYNISIIVQLVFVSAVFLWGWLFKAVGLGFANIGFGFLLIILVTIIVWVLKFVEPKVQAMLNSKLEVVQHISAEPQPEIVPEPIVHPEPVVEPQPQAPVIEPEVIEQPVEVVEPEEVTLVETEPEVVVDPQPADPVVEQTPPVEPVEAPEEVSAEEPVEEKPIQ